LYQPEKNELFHYEKQINVINSLSSDIIICIHEDRNGSLWIGTPNGLNFAIPGDDLTLTFTCYQQKDGLPNNYIHSILEDNDKNLWISTDKGISQFNYETNTFLNFDVNDGLQSNSFMDGVALKDESGKFYIGGISGLNVFHPDSLKKNVKQTPIILSKLKIYNSEVRPGERVSNRVILEQSLPYTENIELTNNESSFTIEFSTLDYQSDSRQNCVYKMEGLDENWYPTGTENSVSFSNLKAGDYVLRVASTSNFTPEKLQEAVLNISVLPPFWASNQALALYVFLFLVLLILYRHLINLQNSLRTKLEMSKVERKKDLEFAQMKTRFFTNIAHELRTPVTLITGPLESMIDSGKLEFETRKSLLSNVLHQSKRLKNLVNQLLDFRKIESGQMELKVVESNIVKFCKEVFLSFKEFADQKNISFEFDSEVENLSLYFDSDKTEMVLCNLLSNAFKYTPPGETVSFSVKEITEANGEKYCEIIIKDSGKGMPQETLDKIFDRFYQIVNTESVKLIGTGIGLALVKNIVELHHGRITVQSELNKGSQFVINLPLGRDHLKDEQINKNFKSSEDKFHYESDLVISKVSEPEQILTEKKLKEFTILVVEDNPEILQFVSNILNPEYTVLNAINGQEALKLLLKDEIPDLIITDLMMPKMNGISLIKSIRENEKLLHIPVILLTARSSSVFHMEGYESGVDAYITKPFKPNLLMAQVNSLIENRQRLKEYFGKKITLEPTDIEITDTDEEFINDLISLVETNLNNEDLSREFLAKSMAQSSSTLYRKLKEVSGMTTNAFIRSIRLKKAGYLLKNSNLNISEAAYQVGFNDLKYFRSCFKKQFGIKPSEYSSKNTIKQP
jgi:signal transduction histidine kinase/DNA-binding response OmpR family regulator